MPELSFLLQHVARTFAQAPHWHLLAAWPEGDEAGCARALARLLALLPAARRLPGCPPRITLTAVLPGAVTLAQVRQAGAAGAAGEAGDEALPALLERLQPQWHGLLPGLHALDLGGGDRLLLALGAAAQSLDELHGPAHGLALLGQGWPALLGKLPPLCQPQAGLWLQAPHWPDQAAARLRACGMQADGARGFFRYAPHWAAHPRSASRQAGHAQAPMPHADRPGRCFIVGAGLAAASLARSLAARGWRVSVLGASAQPADGASGLPAGVAAAHVSPDDCTLSRLTRAGVRASLGRAARLMPSSEGQSWAISGVLERHAAHERRLPPGWAAWAPGHPACPGVAPASAAQLAQAGLPAADGPAQAGAALPAADASAPDASAPDASAPDLSEALWHAHAGWIRTPAFIAAQLAAGGIEFIGGQRVARLARAPAGWLALDEQGRTLAQAELAVIAAGFDTRALLTASFAQTAALPLAPLRGQAAWGPAQDWQPDTPETGPMPLPPLPPFAVNGHGNFIPQAGGIWMTGSTFERSSSTGAATDAAHAANWQRLCELLPAAARRLRAHWPQARRFAAVRCTAPDRLPFIGPLAPAFWRAPDAPPQPGESAHASFEAPWVYAGLGARGIALGVLCAEVAACWLHGEPLPIEKSLALRLLAGRLKPGS